MSIIKRIIPANLYRYLINFYNDKILHNKNVSYSQEGEDLILKRYFDGRKNGFYIDIGAHHPTRFSNTYLFYKLGWRGVNIEARPGSKKLFDKIRPRDINIEVAIAENDQELNYFIFDDPALNSFDENISIERHNKTKYKILKCIKIKTRKLSDILDEQIKENLKIDFISIDTEGFDLKVLKSNNWEKYIPEFILCEEANFDLTNPHNSEIYRYLKSMGYDLYAKTINTLIFKKQ